MKLRVDMDGETYLLNVARNGAHSDYELQGSESVSGKASVIEVMPGVFSVLLHHQSFTVDVAPHGDGWDVWVAGKRHQVSIADARDRSGKSKKISDTGPIEVRAQMPGKVIKVLVQAGETVEAGQGVMVVEAMKMQNEMKSPKDGVISKIYAAEGVTVAAGETLLTVE